VSNCLKIGDRLLDGDQIISALVRYRMLDTLVGQVLLDEGIETIALSKQEVFEALVGATSASAPEDFEGFLGQWCQSKGITPDYFNGVMVRELRLEKFKRFQFAPQIESEFLRSKSELDQVEYSVIQLDNLALAQELYFQLRDDGTDFAELARQFSPDREGEAIDWVGPVPMAALPVDVAMLFRHGQVGTVYGPIPVADQYWVVRLERFTAARLTNGMRASLMNRLFSQWLQSQVKAVTAQPGAIAVLPAPARQLVPSADSDEESAVSDEEPAVSK